MDKKLIRNEGVHVHVHFINSDNLSVFEVFYMYDQKTALDAGQCFVRDMMAQ